MTYHQDETYIRQHCCYSRRTSFHNPSLCKSPCYHSSAIVSLSSFGRWNDDQKIREFVTHISIIPGLWPRELSSMTSQSEASFLFLPEVAPENVRLLSRTAYHSTLHETVRLFKDAGISGLICFIVCVGNRHPLGSRLDFPSAFRGSASRTGQSAYIPKRFQPKKEDRGPRASNRI